MISTLERDNSIEGILFGKMKELPDWYGLTGVGFIWHGEWNDPEIEYKGKRINATIVEDTMWERWIRDDDGRLIDGRESDDDGFRKFMLDNKDEVYELIDIVNYAMDHDIPYFAVNVPNDMCTNCGHTGEIGNECPVCGCTNIRRLRRVTGYLTGDYKTAFNIGKQQEVELRTKHSGTKKEL